MLETEFWEAVKGLPLSKSEFFHSVGSTNDVVAGWEAGSKGLCLAYADEQTHGRGRAGRSWSTPKGSALAFSVLLDNKKNYKANEIGLVSGLGALAVCEALESLYKLTPEIKWPNDVLLDGKKVCGVLAEAHWTGASLQALILGIGINVAPHSVPPLEKITFPATCIEDVLGKKVEPTKLLRAVLEGLISWNNRMNEAVFVKSWELHLAYKGQRVKLDAGNNKLIEGEILGLTKDGRLQIRLSTGETQAFVAGEIQMRPVVAGNMK